MAKGRTWNIESRFDRYDPWSSMGKSFKDKCHAEWSLSNLRHAHTIGTLELAMIHSITHESDEWYAYTNEEQNADALGNMIYIPVGPERVFSTPAPTYHSEGDEYVLLGRIELDSGAIEQIDHAARTTL